MTPFQSLRDYEEFVYTLQKQFPSILQSTLVLVPRGRRIAILQGDILFEHGFRLSIKERLSDDMAASPLRLMGMKCGGMQRKYRGMMLNRIPTFPNCKQHSRIINILHLTSSITASRPPDEF